MVMEPFDIRYQKKDFLRSNKTELSQYFVDELNFSMDYVDIRASEHAIGEAIIYPVLKEIYKQYTDDFVLWSHKAITYDENLTGIPDYMFAVKSDLGRVVLGKPIVIIVEAKKNNFEEGWGQCLAEMATVQKINGNPQLTIYGIVTDGDTWRFGSFRENEFIENKVFLTIHDLEQLLGGLDFILEKARASVISK